jgi:hypothetical protein
MPAGIDGVGAAPGMPGCGGAPLASGAALGIGGGAGGGTGGGVGSRVCGGGAVICINARVI